MFLCELIQYKLNERTHSSEQCRAPNAVGDVNKTPHAGGKPSDPGVPFKCC